MLQSKKLEEACAAAQTHLAPGMDRIVSALSDPETTGRPRSRDLTLALMLGHSLRLRALLSMVADQVLRQGEKAIIWTSFPHLQKALAALLCGLGIHATPFLSAMDQSQRARLVSRFNTPGENAIQVLVCSYLVSPAGYNLQGDCRFVHVFDPPSSEAARTQAIGRTYRIGQRRTVVVLSYASRDTFHARLSSAAMAHAAMINLAFLNQDQLWSRFGHESMTDDEHEQLREGRGFWIFGDELTHSAHPSFAAEKARAEAEGVTCIEFSPHEFGVSISQARVGRDVVLDGGVGTEFRVGMFADGEPAEADAGAAVRETERAMEELVQQEDEDAAAAEHQATERRQTRSVTRKARGKRAADVDSEADDDGREPPTKRAVARKTVPACGAKGKATPRRSARKTLALK
jgi:superfamily II DNA/RNA helicase